MFDISRLNPEQKQAVETVDGPMAVLAGAGSGKTRVLISKVLHMIENHAVAPEKIMMVTFTNKAAKEMKERMGRTLGMIGTFHSLGARILRDSAVLASLNPGFVIFDESDKEEILKKIIEEEVGKSRYPTSYYANKISQAKDALISPSEYNEMLGRGSYSASEIASIYEKYEAKMLQNNAVDFDDLIYKTSLLLRTQPKILQKYTDRYSHFLVDEFQDTNTAQYLLTKLLANQSHNITVVGDFSQSIYSWRGAEIENLNRFIKEYSPKIVYLERNYRSTEPILNFAYEIINENKSHPILKLHTDKIDGEEIEIKALDDEQHEALFVANQAKGALLKGKKFAVLYRINAQSRNIEEALLHQGVPYTLVGGTRFYDRKEIKDILCYLRLILNPKEEVALKRALKIGKRKYASFEKWRAENDQGTNWYESIPTVELIDSVNENTQYLSEFDSDKPEEQTRLENIKELRSVAFNYPKLSEFLEQVTLVESEYSQNEKLSSGDGQITLMTLHQAKGLEFDEVIIVGAEEGILPHSRSLEDNNQLEEERRLFYVGITRAMENLKITYTKKRFFFGRRSYVEPSRFLQNHLPKSPLREDVVYF